MRLIASILEEIDRRTKKDKDLETNEYGDDDWATPSVGEKTND